MKSLDIILAGVGGQGSLLASRLLGDALVAEGYDVKISEVHGMAQRGGSVVTYVRAGERVASPIVCEGEADLVAAFEELEAIRYLPMLKKGGIMAVNRQHISPMPVITGSAAYPDDISARLEAAGANVVSTDAMALAMEAGNIKCVNVVMLGLATACLNLKKERFIEAIKRIVPQRFVEMNLNAFDNGHKLIDGRQVK